MTTTTPQPDTLPSSGSLLRSTAIAAAVAVALLLVAVLPAEYGIDPTGVGRVLGLARMGEIKSTLEKEAHGRQPPCAPAPAATDAPPPGAPPPDAPPSAAAPAPAAPVVAPADTKTDVTRVTLAPGEGKEVKLKMRAGGRVAFSWSTDSGAVNYDLHSDHPTKRSYHGYDKGLGASNREGTLVAAFDGLHGWFWRNRTDAPVTITLETDGQYEEVKEMK
jgi:hypothetical protein